MPPRPPARRFDAQRTTTMKALKASLGKMSARNFRITEDHETGACEIGFDRSGKRYVFRCSRWFHPDDNLRAAQLTIQRLYEALETYGVQRTTSQMPGGRTPTPQEQDATAFSRLFLGFEATPDDHVLLLPDGSRRSWWEVLGVAQTASREDVQNAYRALARVHHPDAGGNADSFRRVVEAYKLALAEVERKEGR